MRNILYVLLPILILGWFSACGSSANSSASPDFSEEASEETADGDNSPPLCSGADSEDAVNDCGIRSPRSDALVKSLSRITSTSRLWSSYHLKSESYRARFSLTVREESCLISKLCSIGGL